MKIGIDARWIISEPAGIEIYTRELIRELTTLGTENRYVLFFDNEELKSRTLSETGAGQAENFSACVLPFGLFSLKNQWLMPRVIAEQRLDVFHSTNYMIPLLAFPRNRPGRVRCVTTIHDLIPLIFPEFTPRSRKNRIFPVYRWLMHQIGMRSDIIITDSQCSRRDILRHLRIPQEREDRVLAIPIGVSPLFRSPDACATKPEKGQGDKGERQSGPGLGGAGSRTGRKTILWVGRPDPYKNLVGLVEAFAKLREFYKVPTQLRLAGPKDDRYPEASRRATTLGIQDNIEWLGYVTEEQLVKEYQQADVFVLPSRYEGFGLPVIEAMACGTPVICSNKGSLPEVAGDAALKVQPEDGIGMAEAIKRVLIDPHMAGDMITQGLQQASKFTWTETARQTLEAYQKAIA